jgi:hypothetical protein
MQGKTVPILGFVVGIAALLFAALLALSAHLDPAQATDFSELLSVSKAQATDLSSVADRSRDDEPDLFSKLRSRPLR